MGVVVVDYVQLLISILLQTEGTEIRCRFPFRFLGIPSYTLESLVNETILLRCLQLYRFANGRSHVDTAYGVGSFPSPEEPPDRAIPLRRSVTEPQQLPTVTASLHHQLTIATRD